MIKRHSGFVWNVSIPVKTFVKLAKDMVCLTVMAMASAQIPLRLHIIAAIRIVCMVHPAEHLGGNVRIISVREDAVNAMFVKAADR
mgnify:CR=1 FL=1